MDNLNYNDLLRFVQTISNRAINNSKIEEIVTGLITKINGSQYTLQIGEGDKIDTIIATPLRDSDEYQINDYVYTLAVGPNANIRYFILGSANESQNLEDFLNLSPIEMFYDTAAPIDLELEEIIDKENKSIYFDAIRDNGVFKLEAVFSSNSSNNYGIMVEFKKEGNTVETHVLDTNYFVGQPSYLSNIKQERVVVLSEEMQKIGAFDSIYFTGFGTMECSQVKLTIGAFSDFITNAGVKIKVVKDKNYFQKNVNEDKVQLQATLYINNKRFVAPAIQYYWVAEDREVTSSSPNYLSAAGEGWYCLNNKKDYQIVGSDGSLQTIQRWDSKSTDFSFTSDKLPKREVKKDDGTIETKYFYQNKIKCIIKYQNKIVESDTFYIFNHKEEDYSAEIESDKDPAIIVDENDSVTLTCKVKNLGISSLHDYIVSYQWYKAEPAVEEILDGYTGDTLILLGKEVENTDVSIKQKYYLNANTTFYCKITIKRGNIEITTENSNQFFIQTFVGQAVELKTEIKYEYLISEKNNLLFIEINEDSIIDWNGEGAWNEGTRDNIFQDFNIFNDNNFRSYPCYVYYKTQVTQILKANGEDSITTKENWTYPLIAREVGYQDGKLTNLRAEAAIDSLNVFNSLTQGGSVDGLYYANLPMTAINTSTEDPKIGIHYYVDIFASEEVLLNKKYKFKNGVEYYIRVDDEYEKVSDGALYDQRRTYYKKVEKRTLNVDKTITIEEGYADLTENEENFAIESVEWPDEVVPGTVYYNLKDKLLINATYIRSGTLEVPGRFLANIDTEAVQIAGFTVDDDSISSGSSSSNFPNTHKDYLYFGKEGLTISDFLDVRRGAAYYSGKIKIYDDTEEVENEDDKYMDSTEIVKHISEYYISLSDDYFLVPCNSDGTVLIDTKITIEARVYCGSTLLDPQAMSITHLGGGHSIEYDGKKKTFEYTIIEGTTDYQAETISFSFTPLGGRGSISATAKIVPNIPGKDGHTPTIEISEDDYWIIDGEKTDNPSRGPQGEQGIQGEKGEKGDQGEQGAGGRGIKSIAISTDGKSFIFSFTDGTTQIIAIPSGGGDSDGGIKVYCQSCGIIAIDFLMEYHGEIYRPAIIYYTGDPSEDYPFYSMSAFGNGVSLLELAMGAGIYENLFWRGLSSAPEVAVAEAFINSLGEAVLYIQNDSQQHIFSNFDPEISSIDNYVPNINTGNVIIRATGADPLTGEYDPAEDASSDEIYISGTLSGTQICIAGLSLYNLRTESDTAFNYSIDTEDGAVELVFDESNYPTNYNPYVISEQGQYWEQLTNIMTQFQYVHQESNSSLILSEGVGIIRIIDDFNNVNFSSPDSIGITTSSALFLSNN